MDVEDIDMGRRIHLDEDEARQALIALSNDDEASALTGRLHTFLGADALVAKAVEGEEADRVEAKSARRKAKKGNRTRHPEDDYPPPPPRPPIRLIKESEAGDCGEEPPKSRVVDHVTGDQYKLSVVPNPNTVHFVTKA